MFQDCIFEREHFKYIPNNKTIATATRETFDTIYATADKSSTINTITTITIATIRHTTSATSVINSITSDTGAGVSEFKIEIK